MSGRRSTRRTLQAQDTRRDILAAARRLFATRGYAATSMAAIAAEANVVVQTIYASVGPKSALLLALLDLIDEQGGVGEIWGQLNQTEDPATMVALIVRLTRQISERCGDIVWTLIATGPGEPDLAAAAAEGRRRHRAGIQRIVERLVALDALQPGLSAAHAADVFAVLTWHDTYRNLTQDYGWSFDECEAWLTATVRTLLLPAA